VHIYKISAEPECFSDGSGKSFASDIIMASDATNSTGSDGPEVGGSAPFVKTGVPATSSKVKFAGNR
jgi:hypothetical protein